MSSKIIDADGHLMESDREIYEYLDAPYRGVSAITGYPFFPTLDGFQRGAIMGRLGMYSDLEINAKVWRQALDETRMDWTVLYPTAGLAFGLIQDAEWATALARAYNDWFTDRYHRVDKRIKGMALIPLQDPAEAVKELERAVKKLHMVGAVLPGWGLKKPLGHPDFFPIYETAQRLNVPVAVHGAATSGLPLHIFEHFAAINALSHPISQMIQMTGIALGGVLDRFPKLRIAFLEAGATWAVYMIDRLDRAQRVWRGKGRLEYSADLKRAPSEHIKSGRIFFTVEPHDADIPYAIEKLGAGSLMFASDFPHENNMDSVKHDIEEFGELEGVDEEVRAKMLAGNAMNFYQVAA
jgi:predicted TIM-barrel fold metal-dependent hydrolase